MNCILSSVENELFSKYVTDELEYIYERHAVKALGDFGAIKLPGTEVYYINGSIRNFVRTGYC